MVDVVVEEFHIKIKEWVVIGQVLFQTGIFPFGEGGFRYAFKPASNHHKFSDGTYVLRAQTTFSIVKDR